jgi:hypothetical protein
MKLWDKTSAGCFVGGELLQPKQNKPNNNYYCDYYYYKLHFLNCRSSHCDLTYIYKL